MGKLERRENKTQSWNVGTEKCVEHNETWGRRSYLLDL